MPSSSDPQLPEPLKPEPVTKTISSDGREQSELGCMLSIESTVSATWTQSIKISLQKIGAGTCGTILAQSGLNLAYKMAKNDTDALTGDLLNDFRVHNVVQCAMKSFSDGVNLARVPRIRAYISRDYTSWWNANAPFSAAAAECDVQVPTNVLCMERIESLPASIRSQLVNRFCPEVSKQRAQQDISNKDCLVRVYLGAHRVINPRSTYFSLRNYKLHLDQMLELGMDTKALAKAIAGTLACLHWKARIDAKDIEFVLGLSSGTVIDEYDWTVDSDIDSDTFIGPQSERVLNWHRRRVILWVLDFNLCSRITMDQAGVDMAAKAWQINDPYYPKPLQGKKGGQELWNGFVSRYIEVSDQILQSEPDLTRLPRDFIASIVQIQREKNNRKAQNMTD